MRAFASIMKTEGARGLYQGMSPNMLGNASAWGSYFLGYVGVYVCARMLCG